MKRVLFVDQSQVLGGAELSLIDISVRMPESAVAVFDDGEFSRRLIELGVPAINLDVAARLKDVKRAEGRLSALASIPGLLGASMKLARHARSFDIIYANTQKAMLVAGIAGKLSRKPVIWHLRDLLTTDHFSAKLVRVSVSASNAMVSIVIANSRATADCFVSAGGSPSKVVVVHNGIDPAPFLTAATSESSTLRRQLGTGGGLVAGVFSRIAEWKGQHVLIEAASRLDDWHVLIVGEALFQNDEEYRQRLNEMVRQLGMEDRVHFLGFRNDVPHLMTSCDVVVHTSTSPEPFGRVIVEGMLARTPVIAARGGGASEIVRHGENGFLFDAGQPEQLSALLTRLANGEGAALQDIAYEEATGYYSVERLVDEVKEVINAVGDS